MKTRFQAMFAACLAAAGLAAGAEAAGTNPPAITVQPQSVSQINGFPASFSVTATGAPPLFYQWRRSGTNIVGAVGASYGWSAIQPGLMGSYDVVVTNSFGPVTSAPVTLTVLTNTASCTLTNLRLTPLNELGLGAHKGYSGGLYPNGLNSRPPAHDAAGRNLARNVITPRNFSGAPDTNNGRIVLLSIGMSNTTQEWNVGSADGQDLGGAFTPRATNDPSRNPRLVIADGAQGGRDTTQWTNASTGAWTNVPNRLAALGVNSNQVQAIWIKQAIASPSSLGSFPAHAVVLQNQLELIARAARVRFTNLAIIYFSSRTRSYAANATLNPEPYAYEGGFSVKWLIEKQLNGQLNYDPARGPVEVPWLAWGPYLWADGTTTRADGFVWDCQDVRPDDYTHPGHTGVRKVADQLLNFFKTDPTATPWFLRTNIVGQAPVCAPAADVTSGTLPLLVTFAANATDPDGSIVEHRWTFDDGDFSTNANPVKLFAAPGNYSARLTVADNSGNTASGSVMIKVQTTLAQWTQARFTAAELLDPLLAGEGADADSDRVTNALEYALGLDPRTFNGAGTGLPRATITNGHFTLVFTRNKPAADAVPIAEFSDDLQTWHAGSPWTEEIILADTGLVETVSARRSSLASTNRQGFIRLRLLRP